jgi:hypothetical protein
MEGIAAINNINSVKYDVDGTSFDTATSLRGSANFNSAIIRMVAEGGENFYRYLKSVNLSRESDILVLPSSKHYYYEEKELKQFRTIINLKKLNHIKHPGKFLTTLIRILPDNVNFIGCFSDDNSLKGKSFLFNQPSRLLRRFINFLDSRTDHVMDKKEVSDLLEAHGFRVVNMTEINGLIYFYSQNVNRKVELMAS